MKSLFLSLSVLFCSVMAFAQAVPLPTPLPGEPNSIGDVVGFGTTLISLVKEGKFLAAGSVLTLLLVFAFRKYGMEKLKVNAKLLPVIAAVLGLIAGLSLAIVGGAPAQAALLATLSGPLASTLWSVVGKYIFIDQKAEAAPVDQPK